MKRILLISSYCFEKASANGLCAIAIKEELKKRGYTVDILGVDNFDETGYTLKPNEYAVRLKKPKKRCKTIERVKAVFRMIKNCVVIDKNYDRIRKYKAKAFQLDAENHYDAVIAFFFGFENVIVAKQLKNKRNDIKFIIYELDSAVDGINNYEKSFIGRLHKKAKIKWTKKQYKNADMVCVMRCHEEHVQETYIKDFSDKIKFLDLPLLTNNIVERQHTDKQSVAFLYTGWLSKSFRNPEWLLQTFTMANREKNWALDFYSSGDCEDLISEYSKKNCGIQQHGYIDSKMLDEKYKQADFLISIGNRISNSMPSKTINYVSFGKPIIHVAAQKHDVCAEWLKKYPLALVIEEDENSTEAVRRLQEFVKLNKDKDISITTLFSIYPENTPEYSVSVMEKCFNQEVE